MHILTRSSAVAAAAALSVVALGVGPAAAHVRVSSADAAPGGYGELTFRVPTESDTASTVRVAVQLPTDTPLASVSTKPVPGWTATTERTTLDAPVTVHGSEVTEVVSQVVWTADPGAGIAPGEYQTFSISAGPMPDTGTLALPAVQTYDDGTEAAWIEPTVDGQEEPEHPAPVLELTAAAGDTQGVSAGSPTDTTATSTAAAPDDGPSGLAVTGLVVAVVALLAALAGLVTGRRRTPGA
ncbi:YcnI family protein [Modestobacter sp. SSW1-42]|uniref:YcnI family copper-binding membrane protein n=1 Tax=Modestobacter sp. SSW1-42 TaxID=596372 RepID=UPI003986F5C2